MSDSTVRFLTDVAYSGGISFSKNYVDFPSNPQPRTIVVKDGVAYLYTELVNGSGYFTWQPISLKQTAYLHTQSTPSTTWTVTHDFNSTDFAYFVYDSTHRLMLANIQIIDANTVQILMADAETGTAVFFSLNNISAPALTATSSVNLGSLTLRDGSGQLTVNDSPVALASDVSSAITAALSTFSGSSADANAYTDAAIAAALSGVVGTPGATGYTGSAGAAGSAGAQGAIGYTGSKGDTGAGTTGATGYTGSAGSAGSTGGQGPIGYTGSKGDTGAGTTGATGYTGSAGSAGSTGGQGPIGYTGSGASGNITIGSTSIAVGGTTTTLAGLTSLTVAGTLKTTAFQETSVAMAALNVDLTAGNFFTKTITAICTLTVTGTPSAGTVGEFIIKLTNGAAFAVTWFTGTKWAGGVAPTLTAAGVDTLGFYTVDGGTTWYGYVLGKDSK